MQTAFASEARTDLDLTAYKGRVVYLDFWASWCVPCRLSFPWMNSVSETLGPKGLVVIGVNVDRDRAAADSFLRSNAASFRIVYDPRGRIASEYQFTGMPTSILIDRNGRVHSIHSGFFLDREAQYFADISNLLKQAP